MTDLFLKIVNMSISASWIVLAVLVLRLLFKKAPGWVNVLLWGIVAVRLICPFSLESTLSLIPSAETVSPDIMLDRTPEIHTGIPMVNSVINPVISTSFAPDPATSANPLQLWIPTFAGIWIIGMAALLIYTVISFGRLKKKIGTAVKLRENVYQSENVASPFVLGIIKPKIYLPFCMDEETAGHVIAHEKAHIRRKDHLWKPLGFLLLTLHWFNPLMWLGYVLLCRDIELACDEKVICELGPDARADYSQALLSCSVKRRTVTACPLAFGEVDVKTRVRSVLHYKKPAFWIVLVAVIGCIALAICFLTDPPAKDENDERLDQITSQEGYTIWYQEKEPITLTVPASALTEEIYSPDGKTYENKSVIVYEDETTTVFLKHIQSQTETQLLMQFDFSYTLPEEKGSFLWSWKKTDNGYTNAADLFEYTVRDENGEYERAVLHQGQGSGNVIGYYVMKDVCRSAKGYLSFDVVLNRVSYYRNGLGESVSTLGGAEGPQNVILTVTDGEVEKLRAKFPNYFDLPVTKGLEVYIWQMAENSYSCGLLPGRNLNYTKEELWELHKSSATLEEMRIIVSSYFPDITQNDVVICPIQMPHSGYAYTIDEAYGEKLETLFWSNFPVISTSSYSPVIDTATFDIDSDGVKENCTLAYGPTSGLFTFTLTVWEPSENGGTREFYNVFLSDAGQLSFAETENGWKLRLKPQFSEQEIFYDFSVLDGNIVLTSNGESLGYWGVQGTGNVIPPETEWAIPPTEITFEARKGDHRLMDGYMEHYEENGKYYHRVFKKCIDCGEVVEADAVYECRTNNSLCRGACLSGVEQIELPY